MSFGRPHSSDSWSSQRTYDFSSRMHSVPRYNKSPDRYRKYAYPYSAFDSKETSWSSGVTRSGECSHRCSARPSDRVKSLQLDREELKRKSVFVLHDEIRKAPLVFPLEEISNINIITEMCFNTMAAMMKSKTQRKFLYHRNNNALLTQEQPGDCTANSTFNSNKKSTVMDRESVKKNALMKEVSGGIQEYSKTTEEKQKQREEEILALRKLREKLPPMKKKLKPETETTDTKRKSSGREDSRVSIGADKAEDLEQLLTAELEKEKEVPLDMYEKRKNIKMMSPEEALKCKWLRLSHDQVRNIEEMVIAKGKDPGIHAHSTKGIESVFEHEKAKGKKDSVRFSLKPVAEEEEEQEKPRRKKVKAPLEKS